MPELLQWWNLVYVLAFFFALLYATLNAIGLASHGAPADGDLGDIDADADAHLDLDHDVDAHLDLDHDVDAHIDVDHDLDVGGDVDHDVDVSADHDVDVGADHDVAVDADHDVGVDAHADAHHVPDFHAEHVGAAQGEASLLELALSFFGIGKIPLSVFLMTFLITFAVIGWGVNLALKPVLRVPAVFFPLSCAAAVVCGLGGTKLLAATLGKYLKPIESAAVRRAHLVGRIATACLPVSDGFGMALVRDDYGTRHKVVCKVAQGAPAVPRGQTVLLIRYVRVRAPGRRSSGYYLVEPYKVPES